MTKGKERRSPEEAACLQQGIAAHLPGTAPELQLCGVKVSSQILL